MPGGRRADTERAPHQLSERVYSQKHAQRFRGAPYLLRDGPASQLDVIKPPLARIGELGLDRFPHLGSKLRRLSRRAPGDGQIRERHTRAMRIVSDAGGNPVAFVHGQ